MTLRAEILERHFFGRRGLRFEPPAGGGSLQPPTGGDSINAAIDQVGHVPLPPYIHRSDTADDAERYQTMFARVRGSVAAPTAGLHFDEDVISRLRSREIDVARITHHVGYGTFKPV